MEDAGELVAETYRQIEADLLDYLVSKMIEGDVSGQRAQTAINLLAQSMPLEVKRIIDAHAEEIDAAVRQEVEASLAASDAFDLSRIAQAAGVALPKAALTAQTLAVALSAKEMLARDNIALSEAARSKFLQWSTWCATQVGTGAMTADKALRKAVRELAKGGISVPFVTYKDEETGKVTVTNHADVAVQRHIRSLIAQGAAQLTMDRMRQGGVGFVEVSSHIGSRPSHAEWHGQCYHMGGAVEVDGVRYEDFEFGTGYRGTCGPYTALGDQLLGVNCRHSFAPWVPGMPRAYSPDPEHPSGLDNDEVYSLTQKQRARERAIRATKREIAAAQRLCDANPTDENQMELSKLKVKLRRQQESMREFIRESNAKCKPGTEVLKRQPRREWAGDMPKSATMGAMKHEEPLVKMSKERNGLSVSPAVNTKEFHDAFDAMPLPKAVSESAYEQAGRILRKADGTQKEHLCAVDARTGELLTDNLGMAADNGRTGFTKEQGDTIRACPNGAVMIHNHPSSTRPSITDVITAASESSVKGSVVVGHDGSVWYVSVDNPFVAGLASDLYNQTKQESGDRGGIIALDKLLEENDRHKLFTWRRMR